MDITKPISDIEALEPLTQKKVYCFLDHAKMLGLDIYIFESRRPIERQRRLLGWWRTATELKKQFWVSWDYAKYKDAKGKVNAQRTRTLVSKHLTGEAVDIVFDMNADPKVKVPSRNGNYTLLIKIGEMYGLDTLAPLERCHLQNSWQTIASCIKKNSDSRNKSTDQWTKDQLHRANERMRRIKA